MNKKEIATKVLKMNRAIELWEAGLGSLKKEDFPSNYLAIHGEKFQPMIDGLPVSSRNMDTDKALEVCKRQGIQTDFAWIAAEKGQWVALSDILEPEKVLSYAYPSSPTSITEGFSETGCWFVVETYKGGFSKDGKTLFAAEEKKDADKFFESVDLPIGRHSFPVGKL